MNNGLFKIPFNHYENPSLIFGEKIDLAIPASNYPELDIEVKLKLTNKSSLN